MLFVRHGVVNPMRVCVVVPSYQASKTLASVLEDLLQIQGLGRSDLLVVDDGSTDGTADVARASGVRLVSHPTNRGKGAALRAGLAEGKQLGYTAALTVDADGQHPAHAARAVLAASDDPNDLVLGVRDLVAARAPRSNQLSNRFSNMVISGFAMRRLLDTQCGLRRYPIAPTLALGCKAEGYAFEAEVLLRASAAKIPIVQLPVDVVYPPEHERVTHFDSVRDPARIVATVLRTMADIHVLRSSPRSVQRIVTTEHDRLHSRAAAE